MPGSPTKGLSGGISPSGVIRKTAPLAETYNIPS
jgi:hypothetical protein